MKDTFNSLREELKRSRDELLNQVRGKIKEVEKREEDRRRELTLKKKEIDEKIVPLASNFEDLKEINRRLLDEISTFKLRNPDPSPKRELAIQRGGNLDLVISCRGEQVKVHLNHIGSRLEIINGKIEECTGKKIVIYVHGYNTDNKRAVDEANDLVKKYKEVVGDREEEYRFILFTWPGDTGLVNFNTSQVYAEYSGESLFKLCKKLRKKYSPKSITVIAHSLGAHVTLRSANLAGVDKFYDSVLLLGPAVESKILSLTGTSGKFWFPEALESIGRLDVVYTKTDTALEIFFSLNQMGRPLGNSKSVKSNSSIGFFDLTPYENKDIPRGLYVNSHMQYWQNIEQVRFYKEILEGTYNNG